MLSMFYLVFLMQYNSSVCVTCLPHSSALFYILFCLYYALTLTTYCPFCLHLLFPLFSCNRLFCFFNSLNCSPLTLWDTYVKLSPHGWVCFTLTFNKASHEKMFNVAHVYQQIAGPAGGWLGQNDFHARLADDFLVLYHLQKWWWLFWHKCTVFTVIQPGSHIWTQTVVVQLLFCDNDGEGCMWRNTFVSLFIPLSVRLHPFLLLSSSLFFSISHTP